MNNIRETETKTQAHSSFLIHSSQVLNTKHTSHIYHTLCGSYRTNRLEYQYIAHFTRKSIIQEAKILLQNNYKSMCSIYNYCLVMSTLDTS